MDIFTNGDGSRKSVSDFYSNQSIFVTGATGFLGKAFIEKILYSCPKISKIFLLIREKKNMTIVERTQKLFDLPVIASRLILMILHTLAKVDRPPDEVTMFEELPYSDYVVSEFCIYVSDIENSDSVIQDTHLLMRDIFNRIKNERPENLKKVVPINGDITLPNLGIKPEDEDMLAATVTMVFHIAAVVKFQEPLPLALEINFKGTKRVLDLCTRAKNLKAFVYVSTAFTNSNIEFMEEVVYPPPMTLDEVDSILDRTSFSEQETVALLGGRPNTYTFTKELAENLVAKYHGAIPAAIVRPSIVLSSKSEPVEGWIDNWYGATGIILPLAQGLNRVMLTEWGYNIDLIPLDYVVNTIIVAATRCNRSGNVAVYNSTSSSENPIEIGNFIRICSEECVRLKINVFPFPKTYLTMSMWMLKLISYIQRLPTILADYYLSTIGKQPRFVEYQLKSIKSQQAAECFSRRTWRMSAKQTCALYNSLSETDKKRFDFDPRNIVWEEFIPTYMRGINKYLWIHEVNKF